MINGKYSKINWKQFEYTKAYSILDNSLKWKSSYDIWCNTCGTAALSTLTGINPVIVESKLPKSNFNWTDKTLITYLKQLKYNTIQLTKYGVTCLPTDLSSAMLMPINNKHVLICNCLVCRDEASWFIVHNNFIWHNLECVPLTPLFFINKPSQSIWLVGHKNWS